MVHYTFVPLETTMKITKCKSCSGSGTERIWDEEEGTHIFLECTKCDANGEKLYNIDKPLLSKDETLRQLTNMIRELIGKCSDLESYWTKSVIINVKGDGKIIVKVPCKKGDTREYRYKLI